MTYFKKLKQNYFRVDEKTVEKLMGEMGKLVGITAFLIPEEEVMPKVAFMEDLLERRIVKDIMSDANIKLNFKKPVTITVVFDKRRERTITISKNTHIGKGILHGYM